MRKVHVRHFEHSAIYLRLFHSRKGKYVSDETLKRWQKQTGRNRNTLEHCVATSELGQDYTLQELADLSISNPKIRRGELMTTLQGLMRLPNLRFDRIFKLLSTRWNSPTLYYMYQSPMVGGSEVRKNGR